MGKLIEFDKKILDLCGTLELLLGLTGMFKDPPLTLMVCSKNLTIAYHDWQLLHNIRCFSTQNDVK